MFMCNKDHIAIQYGSEPCPLCICHRDLAKLEAELSDARQSLESPPAEPAQPTDPK